MVVAPLPAVTPLVVERAHSTKAAVTNASACSVLVGRPFCPDSDSEAVTGRLRVGGTVTGVGGRADIDTGSTPRSLCSRTDTVARRTDSARRT